MPSVASVASMESRAKIDLIRSGSRKGPIQSSARTDSFRFSILSFFSLIGLVPATPSQAAVQVPYREPQLALSTTGTVFRYTVDLSSLPPRPRLIVEATPDPGHGDMTIELEITGCTVFDGGGLCQPSVISPATPGRQSVSYGIYTCDLASTWPAYLGETCDVKVRAPSFGTNPGPASVDLVIRGETVVPTATSSTEVSTAVQTISIPPVRDTTIYQTSTTSSNGQGIFLSSHHLASSDRRNSLLAFDVPNAVPAGATIVGASVVLDVSPSDAPTLELHAIPRDLLTEWFEGPGFSVDGFIAPLPPTNLAATWTHRRWASGFPVAPWSSPGGDRIDPPLVSVEVGGFGPVALSSAALLNHIRALHSGSTSFDGLLLEAEGGGVIFPSREHPTVSARPALVIQFAPGPVSGSSQTGTLNYFSEGQNFRWIYDTDDDNVLVTPIAGRCSVTGNFSTIFDYAYQFQGSPSYAGLDCCTWQIGSRSGVNGAGQAIFYINVSSSDPAYQPGDRDTDGIKDLCDNCVSVPNGPLLGSCTGGSKIGKLCRSNLECGSGGTCSLAQDDTDRVAPANACVPEPSFAPALAFGLLALRGLRRISRAGGFIAER